MTEQWEVVVGNIGTVFNAPNGSDAKLCFEEYKQMSMDGYGRSAHEHVALFRNGEIVQKYNPTNEPEDKMTVEVCDALHKHGALTYKQITDICPSVESAQNIQDMVSGESIHQAYVLSEDTAAYYADQADSFNTPLQSETTRYFVWDHACELFQPDQFREVNEAHALKICKEDPEKLVVAAEYGGVGIANANVVTFEDGKLQAVPDYTLEMHSDAIDIGQALLRAIGKLL